MDLVYGIPALAGLLLVFVYVRRLARRERRRRERRKVRPPMYKSLSQRSEMRAGDDLNSVMDDMQRTQSAPASKHPSEAPSRNRREASKRTAHK